MSTAKQEGDLMTRTEYEALYDEYWNTDSLKRREEIEDKISKAALALFDCIRDIFDRYHARRQLIDDDDYREDRGFIGLAHEVDGDPMIGKEFLYLRYCDRWQYGGECNFTIRLKAKWFESEERKKLAVKLREQMIEKIERAIEDINLGIAYQQKKLDEYNAAIGKLKAGEDAADDIDLDDDELTAISHNGGTNGQRPNPEWLGLRLEEPASPD